MKLGPLTFQCACLAWVTRSNASARRSWRRLTICVRTFSGREFLVLCMICLLGRGAMAALRFYPCPVAESRQSAALERRSVRAAGGRGVRPRGRRGGRAEAAFPADIVGRD